MLENSSTTRRNVALYYTYNFLMDFLLWAGVWIKYLIDDRGLELRWILAMDMPFWLIVAALQTPMGALADHIGRRKVLVAAGFAFGIVVLGFGFTTNYWMLFFDYVLWGIAQSMRSGTDAALLFDTLKLAGQESRYQRIAGQGFAMRLSASVAGIIIGAFVADRFGLAIAVQISCIPPVAAGAVALFMVEPSARREGERYLESLKEGLTFAWRHAEVRYTLLIGAVMLTGTFGPVVLVQPFLIEHHVSTALFGIYQAPLRLTSLVAALIAFWINRRASTGRLFVSACCVIIACYTGLALTSATIAFAFFLLPALVSGLTDPIVGAHLNVRIPTERRATVLSVMPLFFSLQVAFFEPALGFFADGIALRAAFLFAMGYFVVLMPPLMILWWRAHAHSEATTLASAAG
jgi:MFS family permease